MMVSVDATVVVADDQIFSDLAGEVVILDVKQGVYYGLNNVGARVWHLVQTPTTVKALCSVIEQEYDVKPEDCQNDIIALVEDLSARGMVTVKEA